MKENNDIDNLFREGLHQDFPVDDQLWQEVESQLPIVESPKKGFWIYLNSFTILTILGMSMLLRTDNVVSQQGEYAPINIGNSLESKEDIQNKSTVKEKSEYAEKSHELNNKANQPNKVNLKQESTLDLEKVSTKSLTSNISKTRKNQTKTNFTSKSSITEQNSNKALTNAPLLASTKDYSAPFKKQASEIELPELGQFKKLNLLGFNWAEDFSTGNPKRSNNNKINQFQRKLKPHFFEYELEYYQSIEQEKSLGDLPTALTDYRNEGEKSLQVESYGINVFRKVKFLHLGIGLHFSQFQEQAAYDISEVENGISVSYDTTYSIINNNFNSNGTPVILIKEDINRIETPTTEINQRRLVVRNEISRIQLPISLGYRRNFGLIEAGVRTSFVFNYLNQKSGGYISDDRNRLLTFNATEQLNSFVYAHRNQFSLGYALNEFFVLGGRFSYEYDLNSFTKEYDSRLQHYGLGLYLRFQPK